MIPRNRVVSIRRDATHDEVQDMLAAHGHTRMPVYDKSVDDVVGYITAKDVLATLKQGKAVQIESILRPPFFVAETMRATAVLRALQERRTHLAIVVDEHGGVAGAITLEDLIEELVGDIFSEHDAPEEQSIRAEKDGSALVKGPTPIREVNRVLGTDLPEDEDWTTLAGLCTALAGKIPERGSTLSAPDGTSLQVVEVTARAVRLIRVIVPKREPESDLVP